MADRYWVGGTGTWDSTNTAKWSATSGGAGGASVPTSADNVYFDANSGSGSVTVTVPIYETINCFSLTVTRAYLTLQLFGAYLYVGDTGGAAGSGKIEFSGLGLTSSGIQGGQLYLRGGASSSTSLLGVNGTTFYNTDVNIIQGSISVTQQIQTVYTDFHVQSGGTLNIAGNTQFYVNELRVYSGGTIDITSASIFVDTWQGDGTITGASSAYLSIPAYAGGGSFSGNTVVTYGTIEFGGGVVVYGNQDGNVVCNNLEYDYYSSIRVVPGVNLVPLVAVNRTGFVFGTNATLSTLGDVGTFGIVKSSGTVNLPYLVISNCNASGGATFIANTTSVDNGNNTGIQFANSRGLLGFFT